jgi:hypothetical protein
MTFLSASVDMAECRFSTRFCQFPDLKTAYLLQAFASNPTTGKLGTLADQAAALSHPKLPQPADLAFGAIARIVDVSQTASSSLWLCLHDT